MLIIVAVPCNYCYDIQLQHRSRSTYQVKTLNEKYKIECLLSSMGLVQLVNKEQSCK